MDDQHSISDKAAGDLERFFFILNSLNGLNLVTDDFLWQCLFVDVHLCGKRYGRAFKQRNILSLVTRKKMEYESVMEVRMLCTMARSTSSSEKLL
jgi:hypothetical protein